MEMKSGLSTQCVHSGEIHDAEGSPHTPIYNTTTFAFPSTEALLDVVEGRKQGNLYTRYGLNPTVKSLEVKLATIERAESAIAFCSGMAAEAALFLAYAGKCVVCLGDAYGGTLELLGSHLKSLNIPVHFLLGKELDKLASLLQQGIDIVFFETPTNPVLEIFNIKEISSLAHQYQALVCVDNTFATPVNQNPLLLGADVVVHSATKYLGGHKVKKVFYPGLENFPYHQLAKKQMKGFGGMLTIELHQDTKKTVEFVDNIKLFKIAPSLGGAESLVTQPVTTTHHGLTTDELKRRGITGSMVRFSIGFEDAEDLIADLEQALS